MSFIVRNLTVSPVVLDDLGITIPASTTEVTNIDFTSHTIVGGDHWLINAPGTNYYVWYTVDAGGADPAPGGTGLLVAILSADTDAQVATKTQVVVNGESDFNVPAPGANVITVTNATGGPVVDASDSNAGVGVTVTTQGANTDVDFTDLQPQDVALSTDLTTAIGAASLAVLSPLDGTTVLDAADSAVVVAAHNDPHFGIRGGELDQLDDVDLTGQAGGDVLQLSGSTFVPVSPGTLAGSINLGDLSDVDDVTAHTLNVVTVLKGDGTNLDVVEAVGDLDFAEVIEDIVGALIQNGTDTTAVYNDGVPSLVINVDDVFLRNTGDTLDSGTLVVASGATINIATGGDLTITDAPVTATDAANKAYVDSVAAGLDPKESVRYATSGNDIGGTYNSAGGAGGTGEFTGVDLTSTTNFDGLSAGAIVIGDRILVKDQTVATETGIYVVTTAGATGVIERASDQDGSPTNEVSGGNFTFVEDGAVNIGTGWVLLGDGILTLNTDDLVWVQFSTSGQITAGIGISQGGSVFDLDVNDLVTASIVSADLLAFHDGDGTPEVSGSQTRKITAANFLADLDIVNSLGGNGIAVQTAVDVYTARSVVASAVAAQEGITITNGDGVAGNITVGVDINGQTNSADALAATDESLVYDGVNNVSMSGQQTADGVLAISGLTGLTVTTIGGQEVLTLVDTTRASKILSIETTALTWAENRLTANDWMQIGNANDADSGYIVPLNATIVKVAAHTEDDNNVTKDVDLYIDAANQGAIATFTAVNGENEDTDTTLNIDVTAGQKLRLRAGVGGAIEDTVVTVWLKWRG